MQGYCKVHRQRYQVLQAANPPPSPQDPRHPTSPALKYLQASPEITSPLFLIRETSVIVRFESI